MPMRSTHRIVGPEALRDFVKACLSVPCIHIDWGKSKDFLVDVRETIPSNLSSRQIQYVTATNSRSGRDCDARSLRGILARGCKLMISTGSYSLVVNEFGTLSQSDRSVSRG